MDLTTSATSIMPLPYYLLTLPIFGAFATLYASAAPRLPTEKKRAYVLSTLSSGTMSLLSLPFAAQYLFCGLESLFEGSQVGWRAAVGKFALVFFGTYLFADLSIGYWKYPSQVGLLTGWVHHICYIMLMVYCYNTRHTPLFMIGSVMEIPTFDLAISNLFPRFRNDLRFLVSFFFIRIAYHIVVLLDCARPSSRQVTDGSFVPVSFISLAFIMHASWFHGGVKGYLKRRKATRALAETAQPTYSVKRRDSLAVDPATPEDSPLVTPYTPTGSSSLLPAMPHLPTLPQLPQLSQMPTVNIPSFADLTAALQAREQIQRDFKDAVKTRWTEQKDKFSAVKERGLSFSFGELRFRRQEEDGMENEDDVLVE